MGGDVCARAAATDQSEHPPIVSSPTSTRLPREADSSLNIPGRLFSRVSPPSPLSYTGSPSVV